MPDDTRYRDEEWLREQYWGEEKSTVEIANDCGAGTTTVATWMEKFGIERRDRLEAISASAPWCDKDKLQELYVEQGLSTEDIGERLGCSGPCISNWLKRHDIPVRKGGRVAPEDFRSGEKLKELYVARRMAVSEIAERYSASPLTVTKYLKMHGVKIRPRGLSGEENPHWNGGMSEKVCEQCGDIYKTYRSEQRFCSRPCQAEWATVVFSGERSSQYNSVEVECAHCSEILTRQPNRLERNERQFCGVNCHSAWRSDNLVGEDNPNYNSITVSCEHCGEEKTISVYRSEKYQRHYCDMACLGEWRSAHLRGENHPAWSGGSVIYGPGWDKQKRQSVRSRDGYECQSCAMTQEEHIAEHNQKLHVHHITPARKVDDPMERNAESNLITLCTRCHSKWERMAPLRPDNPSAAAD